MFELEKEFSFEAGHQLCHHDGKCRHPHGHSYKLIVKVRHDVLVASGPKKNMLTDFDEISYQVKPLLKSHLDHRWLNDTLETDSPTAEFIARWIYTYLKPLLPHLYSITIFETATSKAIYYEN
jgi:6-pyruvoyltetrahydropterin/6-carboxytetrahydropterin synthase